MIIRRCSVLAVTVLACCPLTPAQGLTVEQEMSLRSVTNPQLGDDFVAFTVIVPRPLSDGPGSAYLHAGVIDGLSQLGGGDLPEPTWLVSGKDSAPGLCVRPGHRAVAFQKRIDGAMQVVVQSIDGGAAEPFAKTPSVAAFRWRPDGAAIAFTALDPLPEHRAAAERRGIAPIVVDEDFRQLSLWLADGDGPPRRLTEGVTVFDFAWSPDGRQLACAIAPRNLVDDSYMNKRLHTVDAAGGEPRLLVDNPGKLGAFAWAPDGGSIAYVSAQDRNDPHAGMLYSVDVESGGVTAWTRGLRGMIEGIAATTSGFLLSESLGVRTRFRHVTAAGEDQWFYEAKSSRLAITGVGTHGGRFAFTASSPSHPAELWLPVTDTEPAEARRLTDSNPGLADVELGRQRVARFRARDGLPIEGILIEPVGHEDGQRHPLVIAVHGGPESHHHDGWTTSYSNWGQLLAARGYVVWMPNYRASTGYGVEFCKLDHGDPMGREFEDHLDAIHHFVAEGLVDRARVGIGGGSYGGYTAAWAATRHSAHFAAAVAFVPFTDIRTKWLTTDIPMEFYYVHYQQKWPWQQPGLLADRSPLSWAERCATPLLLLGGTADPRVHPSQPFMLYRAVKFATDTPVRYVQYPGEGHGNRTNVYRYDYALRTLRWFDHYLQGADRRDAALPPRDLDYAK
ncbi:MAG: S9 family peptidase [Planctomycetes bacterium]|nr:S9 family peptidase [Planctomycetota bacterium]